MRVVSLPKFPLTMSLVSLICGIFLPTNVNAATANVKPMTDEEFKLNLSGYGDIRYSFHDHGANSTLRDGAQKDARVSFDTTRFVVKADGHYEPYDLLFEAEVEIEHGGTGSALELEYEESGEFENEVEKGGEILLEEFYLKKFFFDKDFSVFAGRIKVAFGYLTFNTKPTQYLAVSRPETESRIIPESWNEIGAAMTYRTELFRFQTQIVNGLDSTGFSSQYWIASGHQSRFEETRATDLAYVLRADIVPTRGVQLGVSAYHGGTTRNRPQADLVHACGKTSSSEVAPCGYINAPVTLVDFHWSATAFSGSIITQGSAMWGELKNAGKVSERNRRLSNGLGVARSPVADQAYGVWGEVGYDLNATDDGQRGTYALIPFVRYDQYDTMYKVKSGQIDNPRFAKKIMTVGLVHNLRQSVVSKIDISRRTFGSANLRPETTLAAGLGFVY